MKTITLMACGLILTLAGTGCATKKYVAKTVSPIEARVSQTEGKNNDQDKALAGHGTQIEELDRDLSRLIGFRRLHLRRAGSLSHHIPRLL